ncbi:MAG TPA: nucleotidyltransferase domain-containing protein [Thermoanaerobaculia bacterium]|nr:nucleotidyltransferase domain-containing protein [Thermoanaerobaculia bacterium]
MHRAELVTRLEDLLRQEPDGLIAVYLYGSRARDTARDDSDVDLGVLYTEPPARRFGGPPDRLAESLERELRTEVQVVVLNDAPADLVHRVLRDGVLVLETDRSARIRFEVAKRNEYFDLLPILRRYRRLEVSAS